MKRKKLLAVASSLFIVCLLAISVCATTIYKDADGNTLFSYETESVTVSPARALTQET